MDLSEAEDNPVIADLSHTDLEMEVVGGYMAADHKTALDVEYRIDRNSEVVEDYMAVESRAAAHTVLAQVAALVVVVGSSVDLVLTGGSQAVGSNSGPQMCSARHEHLQSW